MGCDWICNRENKNELEILKEEIDESKDFDEANLIDNYPDELKEEEIDNDNINFKAIQSQETLITTENESKGLTVGYNERAFKVINEIRKNPYKYVHIIKDNKKYVIEENHKEVNPDTFVEEDKINIVYKNKVKVLLHKGKEQFDEIAEILKKTEPMEQLTEKKEILIPLPTESEITDKNFMRNQVNEIRKEHNINVYFKDNIKNPEVAILLMMVDDNVGSSVGKKRAAILNPSFRHIAINSNFIGKKFLAYYSFSK